METVENEPMREEPAEPQRRMRFCVVPKCKNTSKNSPEKYFFSFPSERRLRKIWCRAIKRVDKNLYSWKVRVHCCEDHFDVSMNILSICFTAIIIIFASESFDIIFINLYIIIIKYNIYTLFFLFLCLLSVYMK